MIYEHCYNLNMIFSLKKEMIVESVFIRMLFVLIILIINNYQDECWELYDSYAQ